MTTCSTGEIPVELANLTRLWLFSLSGNQFTGCVPGGVIPLLTQQEFTALGLPACGEEAVPLPVAGDTDGDQAALMAIYNATGGPNWTYPQANPEVHWNPDNRWTAGMVSGSMAPAESWRSSCTRWRVWRVSYRRK